MTNIRVTEQYVNASYSEGHIHEKGSGFDFFLRYRNKSCTYLADIIGNCIICIYNIYSMIENETSLHNGIDIYNYRHHTAFYNEQSQNRIVSYTRPQNEKISINSNVKTNSKILVNNKDRNTNMLHSNTGQQLNYRLLTLKR